jgi:hypothetical protein
MNTLLFCTSFSDSLDVWNKRYRRWVNYYNSSKLNFDQCLIVDDASSCLPDWSDVKTITKLQNHEQALTDKNVLVTFNSHLGRPSTWNYPGWYRSYGFAAKYAVKFNFKKVIHVESDAFLLSDKIFKYINELDRGWTSFWSERYNFPETAIQVICEDQLNSFFWFSTQNYNQTHINKPIEKITPFTNINRDFKGDRYSEFMTSLPPNSDYCCQYLANWNLPNES